MIRTTVVGSYPKVTETGEDNLPGTIDRWQRKLANDADLEKEIEKVIRRVIGEQESAGIDCVTDGQIRREDLVHPIARSAQGIKRGTLKRFFDNNVYYRKLELNGEIRWAKSSIVEEYRFAAALTKKPVKAAIPGPLTLVYSTEPKKGFSNEKLLSLYTDLVKKEAQALSAAGVTEIQIDEPSFRPREPLLGEGIDAVNRILEGIQGRRWVATYFHDVSSIAPHLAKLKAEVLSLDLVTAPVALEAVAKSGWKGEVALGLVDARNTKVESKEDVKKKIAQAIQVIPIERLWLSPNCGLEFLPHASAFKKLQLMKDIAQSV